MNRPRSIYTSMIQTIGKVDETEAHVIESVMRVSHPTLDNIRRKEFEELVYISQEVLKDNEVRALYS